METEATATDRAASWAATMQGHDAGSGIRFAHAGGSVPTGSFAVLDREAREEAEAKDLAPAATRAAGAGSRAIAEQADEIRTCFERDRDRILHSPAFRRLAGKTQVFIFPDDHQRTRLTHALEVSQVATAIARACRLNVPLTEAIALGHDCGHGPGGHASEDAFEPFLEHGYDHAVWGADVALASLNLCRETLDGIRNHSWSRPQPATAEGVVTAWADRVAYCAHDLEDAVRAGIVAAADLPATVVERCGVRRADQLRAFVGDIVATTSATGMVAMSEPMAEALGALRRFNYERIYLRPDSVQQSHSVVRLLRALVECYVDDPRLMPDGEAIEAGSQAATVRAVTYVGGMTDRYACSQAERLLGWDAGMLPQGFDVAGPT